MEEQKKVDWEAKRQVLRWLGKALIVIFLVTGAVSMFQAIFKTVAFDKYPLQDYQMSTWQDDKQIVKSDEQIEVQRKLNMLGDYSGATTLLLLAGGFSWLLRKKE